MIRFRMLGPLSATADAGPVDLGPPRHRRLLAMLLLDADRMVRMPTLIDELWGEDPPASAHDQVHNSVAGIRRRFVAAGADPDLIVTTPLGIRLDSRDTEIDARLADRYAVTAKVAPPDRAAQRLRAALALWTGPSLAGLSGPRLGAAAAHLDERRLSLTEDLIDLEFGTRDPHELAVELAGLVARHPLRERLAGQLMLALYRAGRRTDALAAYRDIEARLRVDLDVVPGAALRERQRAVERDDARLRAATPDWSAAVERRVPAQLPAATSAFTGRRGPLADLDRLAAAGPRIAAVVGGAGGGKTALAAHWAQAHRDRYADGQLWANLRGADGPGTPPVRVLGDFLRALGVPPGDVPDDQDAAAAMFRSTVADRRLLVVLDDAHSAGQVEPLLPGGPECAVLVTSRDRLTGLVTGRGAGRVELGGLPPEEALELLRRTVPDERPVECADDAAELARVCGYLPLALCVSAARLVDDPFLAIRDQVAAIGAGALVDDEDAPVRVAFAHAYAALAAEDRRMFALVGSVGPMDAAVETAAALAGVSDAEAAGSLARLAAAHLIEQRRPGRYTMHDLMRRFAREMGEPDRDAAFKRLAAWYVATVVHAADVAYPSMLRLTGTGGDLGRFADDAAALGWLDAERANLVALTERAAAGDDPTPAVVLTDQLRGYFLRHGPSADWTQLGEAGVRAAARTPDMRGRATAHLCLALAHWMADRTLHSIGHNLRALRWARRAGSPEAEANALANLGLGQVAVGDMAGAEASYRAALAINEHLGLAIGVMVCLSNLTLSLARQGQLREALRCAERAAVLSAGLNPVFHEIPIRIQTGEILYGLGRFDEAHDLLLDALEGAEAHQHALNIELANRWLARVLVAQGRAAEALGFAYRAVRVAESLHKVGVLGQSYVTVGVAHLALGDHETAVESFRSALRLAGSAGERYHEIAATGRLADALLAAGDHRAARAYAAEAVAGARSGRLLPLTATALLTLARAHRAAGDPVTAATVAAEARAAYEAIDAPAPTAELDALGG